MQATATPGKWAGVAMLLVLLFALHLRLAAVLGSEIDGPLRADAGQYFAYAYNLVNHGVYSSDIDAVGRAEAPAPDALRNPGYPLLLTPFARSLPTDRTILWITLAQAALSVLGVLLAFLLARQLLPFATAAGVAALAAMSPHLVNMNVYVLSETAAGVSLLAFLWWFVRCGRDPGARWTSWLLAGALLAVATLVRPTVQWLLIPMLLAAWLARRPGAARAMAGLALGFALVMSPWWARNLSQFGSTSDPSLMVGTLQHGMYPDFMFEGRPETYGYPYRFDPRTEEITRDLPSVGAEIARRFREEPAQHLRWYLLGKPLSFWSWSNDAQGAGDVFIYPATKSAYASSPVLIATHRLMHWLHWPLVVLGMAGMLLCWSSRATRNLDRTQAWGVRACSLVLAYFVAVHIVAAPFPRYSIPVLPLLYVQAIATLVLLRDVLAQGDGTKATRTPAQPPRTSP